MTLTACSCTQSSTVERSWPRTSGNDLWSVSGCLDLSAHHIKGGAILQCPKLCANENSTGKESAMTHLTGRIPTQMPSLFLSGLNSTAAAWRWCVCSCGQWDESKPFLPFSTLRVCAACIVCSSSLWSISSLCSCCYQMCAHRSTLDPFSFIERESLICHPCSSLFEHCACDKLFATKCACHKLYPRQTVSETNCVWDKLCIWQTVHVLNCTCDKL